MACPHDQSSARQETGFHESEGRVTGIGVVGYGYWGPNLVRNFQENPDSHVVGVCDSDTGRLDALARRYPGISGFQDVDELLAIPGLDAVVIATPLSSHYALASKAIAAGKHALVEKPLASSSIEARALIEQAESAGVILMVDHTFVYTGAVARIRDLVQSGEIGEVYYYDSVRVNLGLFHHDADVMWDLAVHDLSIMSRVLDEKPAAVSANGVAHVARRPADIAYLTLMFDSPLIAHVHVNWLAPVKVRKTLIGGSKKMIVYDDLEPSEKVKIYDCGIDVETPDPERLHDILISYRTGDMLAPKIDLREALAIEAKHFIDCIAGRSTPIVDGQAGLELVRVLEAAARSMEANGAPVQIERDW